MSDLGTKLNSVTGACHRAREAVAAVIQSNVDEIRGAVLPIREKLGFTASETVNVSWPKLSQSGCDLADLRAEIVRSWLQENTTFDGARIEKEVNRMRQSEPALKVALRFCGDSTLFERALNEAFEQMQFGLRAIALVVKYWDSKNELFLVTLGAKREDYMTLHQQRLNQEASHL